MNKLKITALSAAIGLAMSASAMGASLSKRVEVLPTKNLGPAHRDLATCEALAGNRKNVCIAETNGRQNVPAKASSDFDYGDSDKHRHDVRIAKADAAYAIANEKCDDLAGSSVCQGGAERASRCQGRGRADADDRRCQRNCQRGHAAADKQAALEKRNAAYAIAKEKCDSLANDAKVTCIQEAKARYGQS